MTGDPQEDGGPAGRGFRVGRAEVTRPAEHATRQMLLQRRDSPLLLAATHCAIGLARAPRLACRDDRRGVLRAEGVLDGHTGDGPVPLSQVRQRVRPRSHSSAVRIAEVLAGLGMLHDDTTAAIRT